MASAASPAKRRPLSQEDDCVSPGGLACGPSLLRTTLSRAAVSGFGVGAVSPWLLTCP